VRLIRDRRNDVNRVCANAVRGEIDDDDSERRAFRDGEPMALRDVRKGLLERARLGRIGRRDVDGIDDLFGGSGPRRLNLRTDGYFRFVRRDLLRGRNDLARDGAKLQFRRSFPCAASCEEQENQAP
jgi:hypothetical protein